MGEGARLAEDGWETCIELHTFFGQALMVGDAKTTYKVEQICDQGNIQLVWDIYGRLRIGICRRRSSPCTAGFVDEPRCVIWIY